MNFQDPKFLKDFVDSYLATAAWVDGEDKGYKFTKAAKAEALADCKKFIENVRWQFTTAEATAILTQPGNDLTYLAPHDFYLTRNGHGAGFWDKPVYDELAENGGDRLTKLAQQMPSTDFWINRKNRSYNFE